MLRFVSFFSVFWKLLTNLPPMLFLLWLFLLLAGGFPKELPIGLSAGDNLIDLPPIGETGDASVVDEVVGLNLAGEVVVVVNLFFRIVSVDSPEFHSPFFAPVDSLLQSLAFAHTPQNEAVMIPYLSLIHI